MFDNLFAFAGPTGTAGLLLAVLVPLAAALVLGLHQRNALH